MGRLLPSVALVAMGAAWGVTLPLTNIAVSTGHQPLGLLLWQQIIMAAVLSPMVLVIRRPETAALRRLDVFAIVAFFGAVLPGYFAYLTAVDLPAGVRSIIIAIVPMFVLPIALGLGFERPDARRAIGVLLGAAAIILIALPGAGLPPSVGIGTILLALIVPLSYGIESNYLAWSGTKRIHPFHLLLGASLIGTAMAWPLATASGQMLDFTGGMGPPEWAMLGAGVLNALAYSGYVWLVSRAGAVFASQISYIVTGFGVFWSKLLLSETYSVWIWGALLLMLAGIALVQPQSAVAKKA